MTYKVVPSGSWNGWSRKLMTPDSRFNCPALTDSISRITVRHIVVEWSLQWMVGHNLTRACNIIHLGQHALQLPCGESEFVSMIDFDINSHAPLISFIPPLSVHNPESPLSKNAHSSLTFSKGQNNFNTSKYVLKSSLTAIPDRVKSRASVKRLLDRVHRHVCGYSTFTAIRTSLLRNEFWTNMVQHYLSRVVSSCNNFKASFTSPPNIHVSLSTLNSQHN